MDYSNLFVCLMGIGTVFVGLVCIILLVTKQNNVPICQCANWLRYYAAWQLAHWHIGILTHYLRCRIFPFSVSAAIAEDMGTDISAIRIISMKQI